MTGWRDRITLDRNGQNATNAACTAESETEAQSAMLASLGCHRYQGYLYGKACAAPAFEALALGAATAPA
mgnify:CR=1 FL=1